MIWKVRKADTGKVYVANDLHTLQAWCRAGRVLGDDNVQEESDHDWRKVSHIFELAAHIKGPTAKPPLLAAKTRSSVLTPSRGSEEKDEATLDLTSMMDMTFILLIFLLIIATPAFQHGMAVDLPQSAAAGKIEKTDVVVSLAPDGQVFLDKEPVSDEDLEAKLRELAKQPSFGKLILRADGSAQHKVVVSVMDIINTSGISNITIATRPKQQ